MYEGALPTTGVAVGVAGQTIGLSWLLAVGVALVLAGILLARLTGNRGKA
jgi:hypothetical protein